jgi:hypothetical protein
LAQFALSTTELKLQRGIGVYTSMHRGRYRVTLPLLLGCVSGLLMIWDLHNNHVIESMGMACDTGPPVWPYQASWIALITINSPAYAICVPLFFLFNLQTATARYPLLFPIIVIWWWWLGRRIDIGLLPSRSHRHRWWMSAALLAPAFGLYYVGIRNVLDDARWWSQYGKGLNVPQVLILLRSEGPALWCFLIAGILTASAFRVVRSKRPA